MSICGESESECEEQDFLRSYFHGGRVGLLRQWGRRICACTRVDSDRLVSHLKISLNLAREQGDSIESSLRLAIVERQAFRPTCTSSFQVTFVRDIRA